MLGYRSVEDKMKFYNKDIDNPYSVNGFNGTWAISDHRLIPETLIGFLQLYFGQARVRRVPLEQINEVMNDIWEGPGSLKKVFEAEEEMRLAGKDVKMIASDFVKAKFDDLEEDSPLSNVE